MFPKLCILSALMLIVIVAVWFHTSQGKTIRLSDIDPQSTEPTYAIHLHSDDWSFWHYTPLPPAPLTLDDYSGKRRIWFAGFFWQRRWPRIILKHDPLVYERIGLETELRLPYWSLFAVSSVLPTCYLIKRSMRGRVR